jgi:aromatic-L-amino-acid decarboxylase
MAGGQGRGSSEEQLDAFNEALMNRLNDSGKLFLSNTVLNGKFALRIAIGNIRTDERAVREAWREIVEQAGRL